jgi:hypothetical protein
MSLQRVAAGNYRIRPTPLSLARILSHVVERLARNRRRARRAELRERFDEP